MFFELLFVFLVGCSGSEARDKEIKDKENQYKKIRPPASVSQYTLPSIKSNQVKYSFLTQLLCDGILHRTLNV